MFFSISLKSILLFFQFLWIKNEKTWNPDFSYFKSTFLSDEGWNLSRDKKRFVYPSISAYPEMWPFAIWISKVYFDWTRIFDLSVHSTSPKPFYNELSIKPKFGIYRAGKTLANEHDINLNPCGTGYPRLLSHFPIHRD